MPDEQHDGVLLLDFMSLLSLFWYIFPISLFSIECFVSFFFFHV